MGSLLYPFKTAVINSLVNGIAANTTCLYAFAANPAGHTGNTPSMVTSPYQAIFFNDWQMLFGKRIQQIDIAPVIKNTQWISNTAYAQYDSNDTTLDQKSFFVICPPAIVGGAFTVYKCINNANGATSTQQPTQVQPSSFTTSDGYTWRYITTITSAQYEKFYTQDYAPVFTNNTIKASSFSYAGVENCVITNGGNGYSSYSVANTNMILSVISPTLVQIQNYESTINNYYVGNAIYIYNVQAATSQLFNISGYTSNSIGNFVTLAAAANTQNIQPAITKYTICPAVKFASDANSTPSAITTINTTSNSIQSIVVLNPGAGITWCNVTIVTNSAAVSSNASVYAIVPPAGGHGFDAATELRAIGMGISFNFANSEGGTIPTNVAYDKIGIINNPFTLNANGTQGSAYVTNTFSSVLQGNLTPTTTMAVGNSVTGLTSGALGIVAFCNGTNISLAGDKQFITGETIALANGTSAVITINTIGQVYTKNIKPLYIQNISNVTRSANNTESYKIIIGI